MGFLVWFFLSTPAASYGMCIGDGTTETSAPSLGNPAGEKVQEEALLAHTAACCAGSFPALRHRNKYQRE